MYVGLNFYNKHVTQGIKELKKDISRYDEEVKECERKIKTYEGNETLKTQILNEYKETYDVLIAQRQVEISLNEKEKSKAAIRGEDKVLTKQIEEKDEIKQKLVDIEKNYKIKTDAINSRVASNVTAQDIILREIHDLQQEIKENKGRMDGLNKDIDGLNTKQIEQKKKGIIKNLNNVLKLYKEQIEQKKKEIGERYELYKEQVSQLERKEQEYMDLITKKKGETNEELKILKEEYTKKKEKFQTELDKENKEIKTLRKTINDKTKKVASLINSKNQAIHRCWPYT